MFTPYAFVWSFIVVFCHYQAFVLQGNDPTLLLAHAGKLVVNIIPCSCCLREILLSAWHLVVCMIPCFLYDTLLSVWYLVVCMIPCFLHDTLLSAWYGTVPCFLYDTLLSLWYLVVCMIPCCLHDTLLSAWCLVVSMIPWCLHDTLLSAWYRYLVVCTIPGCLHDTLFSAWYLGNRCPDLGRGPAVPQAAGHMAAQIVAWSFSHLKNGFIAWQHIWQALAQERMDGLQVTRY